MNNSIKNGSSAPGAESSEMSADVYLQMLKRDLPVAIGCLNAIYSDPEMMANLAAFMFGRWANAQNAKANAHSDAQVAMSSPRD